METEPIITIIVCICIFFAVRELWAWFFKINKILKNQELIISLLLGASEEGDDDSAQEDEAQS
jgi:hypothetical protein